MSAKVGQTSRRFRLVKWKARRVEESAEDKRTVVGQSGTAWEE